MIIAIGNSPSCGSTFLADLMDSLPFAVCGPEIDLFSVSKHFGNYETIRKRGFPSARSPAIYNPRRRLLARRLCTFGIDNILFAEIMKSTNSFEEFCAELFASFASFRGKECTHFFEKSPANIYCAKEFLAAFPNSYFIHLTRDPLYVYKSLIGRRFPPYVAANTWLIAESAAYGLLSHPRFLSVSYEDLVRAPYNVVCTILSKIGVECDPGAVEIGYKNNEYRRKVCARIESWSISKYGLVGNGNRKQMESIDIVMLWYMLNTKISGLYAEEFGICEVAFKDIIKTYGYSYQRYYDKFKEIRNTEHCCIRRTSKGFVKRYLKDVAYGECNPMSFQAYMKPVKYVEGMYWD